MFTTFDRYVADRMKSPAFAKAYAKARAEIDTVDQVMRALDAARTEAKLSKAEIARRISTSPVIVRKLFTKASKNPSYTTISKIAQAIGLRLVLEPQPPRRRGPRRPSARTHRVRVAANR